MMMMMMMMMIIIIIIIIITTVKVFRRVCVGFSNLNSKVIRGIKK